MSDTAFNDIHRDDDDPHINYWEEMIILDFILYWFATQKIDLNHID